MINGMENKFTGIFLCLIPPLIWGGMFPIANHLSATVNMFMMTLVRYSIVALVLTITLLLTLRQHETDQRRNHTRYDSCGSALQKHPIALFQPDRRTSFGRNRRITHRHSAEPRSFPDADRSGYPQGVECLRQ